MDYAQYGQIMNWDAEKLKFTPCFRGKMNYSEKDIQKIMRDCIRGLDYRKAEFMFLIRNSSSKGSSSQRHKTVKHNA